MDTDLTITISEDLRQQAAELAATRGATLENVMREAVAQYVGVHAPQKPRLPATTAPPTSLGARLRMLRSLILDAETPPLDWDELRRELAERRGERDYDTSHLR